MTPNEAKEALFARWVVQLAASAFPTLPFVYDNEPYSGSKDVEFARLAVRNTGRDQQTLGGIGHRKWESRARLLIQYFAILGDEGTKAADIRVKAIANMFEGVPLAGTTLELHEANIREVGPDKGWFQFQIEVPFRFYETR